MYNNVCNHTRDKQIGLPLHDRPILLITRMIRDRIWIPLSPSTLLVIVYLTFLSLTFESL